MKISQMKKASQNLESEFLSILVLSYSLFGQFTSALKAFQIHHNHRSVLANIDYAINRSTEINEPQKYLVTYWYRGYCRSYSE